MIEHGHSSRQPDPKRTEAAAQDKQIQRLAEKALSLRENRQYDRAENTAWLALNTAGIDGMQTLLSLPPDELRLRTSPGAHLYIAQGLKVIALSEGKRWRRYTRAFDLLERAISLAPDNFLFLQDLDWAAKETLRTFAPGAPQPIRADKAQLTRQLEVTVRACETFLETKYGIMQAEVSKKSNILSLDQKAECAWALDNICNLVRLRLGEYTTSQRQTSEFERWLTKGLRAGQAILALYGLPTEARFLEAMNPESFPGLGALGTRELKRIEKLLGRMQGLYDLEQKSYESRVFQRLQAKFAPLFARAEAKTPKQPARKNNPGASGPVSVPSSPNRGSSPPPNAAPQAGNEIPSDFTWPDLRDVSETPPPASSTLAKVFEHLTFDLQLGVGSPELKKAAAEEVKDYQLLKQFRDSGLILFLNDVSALVQKYQSPGEIPPGDLLTMVRYQALLDKLKREWQTNDSSLKEQISKGFHSLETAVRHHHLGKAHAALTKAFAAVLRACQEIK